MDSLKEKTVRGLFWGALNNGTTQILNIVFGIFLARLLSPADYGLVGMLAIFSAIAGNLQSSGFSTAIVNIKHPTANDYNAVFWFNVLTSILIYIVLFFSAPLIAAYFRSPCLVPLSRFIFLSFVISSFGIAHNSYMFKNMMNKETTVVGVVALIVSGTSGLIMALNGMAYWSLAWQQVIYISMVNIGRYYYTPWRPSFKIDFSPIKKMFSFSMKILVTSIINSVSNNILTFIFGRLFTPKVVGNFSQAYKWDTMAYSFVSGTLTQVAQPVLASLNDDNEREKRVFRKMLRFTSFLSFPLMFGLAIVAHEFVIITLSDKWADSIPLMQMLCIGGAFFPFYTLFQNLVISHGRSDIYMWCNIFQILLQISIMLLSYTYGITCMVAFYSAFNVLWLFVWFMLSKRLANLHFMEMAKDVAPFLLASVFVMAIAVTSTFFIDNLLLSMIVKIVIAVALYAAIMKLAHARIMEECMDFVFSKFKKH